MQELEELYTLSENHPILFFDGVCNLCNGFTQFIIRQDKTKKFRFATLQTKSGEKIRKELQLKPEEINTVYLLDKRKFYELSDASLVTSKYLGFPWSLFQIFWIIPKAMRDCIYLWIARNRYQWFGKKDQCMIPTPGLKDRFIDI